MTKNIEPPSQYGTNKQCKSISYQSSEKRIAKTYFALTISLMVCKNFEKKKSDNDIRSHLKTRFEFILLIIIYQRHLQVLSAFLFFSYSVLNQYFFFFLQITKVQL